MGLSMLVLDWDPLGFGVGSVVSAARVVQVVGVGRTASRLFSVFSLYGSSYDSSQGTTYLPHGVERDS